jgi:lipopolysaccharide/colanic/teichoic acid biosynthesis glycosyltransferase
MIGCKGAGFRALKFNTSAPGNRVQRLIVRFGLDKVIQFGNVLRGQMSIVGPRPIPVARQREYERWVPNLLTVKPGITGPWAVGRQPASVNDEMETTLFYIRNYAIWLDLEIIARSVIQVLTGRAAAEPEKGMATHDPVAVHR